MTAQKTNKPAQNDSCQIPKAMQPVIRKIPQATASPSDISLLFISHPFNNGRRDKGCIQHQVSYFELLLQNQTAGVLVLVRYGAAAGRALNGDAFEEEERVALALAGEAILVVGSAFVTDMMTFVIVRAVLGSDLSEVLNAEVGVGKDGVGHISPQSFVDASVAILPH